jgi:hypothetical protein
MLSVRNRLKAYLFKDLNAKAWRNEPQPNKHRDAMREKAIRSPCSSRLCGLRGREGANKHARWIKSSQNWTIFHAL